MDDIPRADISESRLVNHSQEETVQLGGASLDMKGISDSTVVPVSVQVQAAAFQQLKCMFGTSTGESRGSPRPHASSTSCSESVISDVNQCDIKHISDIGVSQSIPTDSMMMDSSISDYRNSLNAQLDLLSNHFDRLISSDGKKKPATGAHTESVYSQDYTRLSKTPRNVTEIMQAYSSPAGSRGGSPAPRKSQSCRSSAPFDKLSTKDWMNNVSQNNETDEPVASDVDPVRRKDSSVDAEVGDFKKPYHSKLTYSGHGTGHSRSRTSLSSSNFTSGNDGKNSPVQNASESDIDYKPPANYGEHYGGMQTNVSSLNMSWQGERERLRNIEALIRSSPSRTNSSLNDFHTWRSTSGYKSNFMSKFNSDYTGRRATSSTDYRSYMSDYKTKSPDDVLNRTYSTPSYRNLNQYPYSPSAGSYKRELSPRKYATDVDDGFSNQAGGFNPSYPPASATDPPALSTPGHSSIGNRYTPSTPTFKNKRYDVKKNKNMSRAVPEVQPTTTKQKKTPAKPRKSKSTASGWRLDHNTTEGDKTQNFSTDSNTSIKRQQSNMKTRRSASQHTTQPMNKALEKSATPSHIPQSHYNHKYKPYNPFVKDNNNKLKLKRTKSDLSSFSPSRPVYVGHNIQDESFVNEDETETRMQTTPYFASSKGNKKKNIGGSKSECRGLNNRKVMRSPSQNQLDPDEMESLLFGEYRPEPTLGTRKKTKSGPKSKQTMMKTRVPKCMSVR